MKKLLQAFAVLAVLGFILFNLEPSAAITSITLPYKVDTADTPKVAWVDANDSVLRRGANFAIDTVNVYLDNGVISQIFKTNTNARMTIDADNNGTGHKFAIINNGTTDTIASFRDDTSAKFFGRVHVTDSVLGATARYTGKVRADSFNTGNENFGYDQNSFTAELTGVSGTVTSTAHYTVVGNVVTISIPEMNGTSDSTGCAIAGLPAAISPATRNAGGTWGIIDNGIAAMAQWSITAGQTRIAMSTTLTGAGGYSAWTASGTKGVISINPIIRYLLK